jgi:hypothetical protein
MVSPLGDVITAPAHLGGLTAMGAEVVKECNRLGILVDLAHARPETVLGALNVATQPLIVSHTGLDARTGGNPRMAEMMKVHLISTERAKVVADAGGVIGAGSPEFRRPQSKRPGIPPRSRISPGCRAGEPRNLQSTAEIGPNGTPWCYHDNFDAEHAFAFGIDLQGQFAVMHLEHRQIIRRRLDHDSPSGGILFRVVFKSLDPPRISG